MRGRLDTFTPARDKATLAGVNHATRHLKLAITLQLEKDHRFKASRPTIGLLCDVLWNQYSCDMWAGVRDAAHTHDANLLYFSGGMLGVTLDYRDQANVIYDRIQKEHVDGLVIWTGQLAHIVGVEGVEAFCRRFRPLPMVSIELGLKGVPSLFIDNYQGMYDLVSHLIEVHHYRRLAYLDYPARFPVTEARYQGYADALRDHGLAVDPNLVTDGTDVTIQQEKKDLPNGAEAVAVLFEMRQLRPQKDIEAIVAVADMTAFEALEALQAKGIRVPDDVALVGFDDLEKIQYTRPALTSVRQSFYEQGWKAAETLLAQIRGDAVPERIDLALKLIVRRSCGCPNPSVTRADIVIDTTNVSRSSISTLLLLGSTQREHCLAALKQISAPDIGADWTESLLESFLADITDENPGQFIATWENILYQTLDAHGDLGAWHTVLSQWRSCLLAWLMRCKPQQNHYGSRLEYCLAISFSESKRFSACNSPSKPTCCAISVMP